MNKKYLVIALAAVVIIGAIIIGVIYFCKDKNPPLSNETVQVQVRKALETTLEFTPADGEERNDILTQTESRNGFEVISCEETQDNVVATLRVYAPNLYQIAKELDENNQFENDEELKNAVIDAINKAEIIEQEVKIEFMATEEGYEPIFTLEFLDAYYGGILKILNDSIKNIGEKVAQ